MTKKESVAAQTYLVAGNRSWTRHVFDDAISRYSGQWHFISRPDELTPEFLGQIEPRYIFFPHWSTKVPDEILETYECVCFHMTDVPYGRGGSPLQNLILRGHKETKLSALRMTRDMDAGPVYLKEPLSLEGSAQEIYERMSELTARMIRRMITEEIEPQPQRGEAVFFKRRKPGESRIPEGLSLQQLYDFIRMLDAEEYPRAFWEDKQFHYEFKSASLKNNRLCAEVVITALEGKET